MECKKLKETSKGFPNLRKKKHLRARNRKNQIYESFYLKTKNEPHSFFQEERKNKLGSLETRELLCLLWKLKKAYYTEINKRERERGEGGGEGGEKKQERVKIKRKRQGEIKDRLSFLSDYPQNW